MGLIGIVWVFKY